MARPGQPARPGRRALACLCKPGPNGRVPVVEATLVLLCFFLKEPTF